MLEILFPSLKEGKNCKTFLALRLPPDMQHFSHSSQYATFYQSLVNADFGIGPDILIKVFEGYIILLISTSWLLLNFYIKQKQRFLVWSITKITSFISSHEGISSITKNTKKCWLQLGNFKYNKNKKEKLKQNLLTQ